MTSLAKLKRVRWGVRAALALGVAASVAGNVLHAQDNAVSRVISAWSPLALLITIELIARVPVHGKVLAFARMAATAVIAGIAAWVSYWHMAAVAGRYGEAGTSPYLIPLSVDGLVVVASICLVELGGRIREAETTDVRLPVRSRLDIAPAITPLKTGPVFDYAAPIGPVLVDKLTAPAVPARKPHPSTRERVERAHKRTPSATNDQLAERLKVSTKTVQRYRPEREPEKLNGREPDLEAVPS